MPGMQKTMSEFKSGSLHSGSKTGPKVTSRKQAIAIGLNSQKKSSGYAANDPDHDGIPDQYDPKDVAKRPSLKALTK